MSGDWLPRTDSPFYSPGSHQSLLSRRSGASALRSAPTVLKTLSATSGSEPRAAPGVVATRPLETDFEPGRGSLMSTLRRDPFRSPDRVLSPVHSRKKPRGGSPTKPTLRALVAGRCHPRDALSLILLRALRVRDADAAEHVGTAPC
eukprot:2153902-Rhodomonas_salina.1